LETSSTGFEPGSRYWTRRFDPHPGSGAFGSAIALHFQVADGEQEPAPQFLNVAIVGRELRAVLKLVEGALERAGIDGMQPGCRCAQTSQPLERTLYPSIIEHVFGG